MQQRSTNNGGIPACASCKHQRKKCTDKCVLAPYFPAGKSREFQAVHRLFGVSNVTKIVKSLSTEDERKRAVESLVWEACCRQKDPVLGSYGEFSRIYEELKLYKNQQFQYHHQQRLHCGGLSNNNNNVPPPQGTMTTTSSTMYKSSSAAALIGWSGGGGGGQVHHNINYSTNNNKVVDYIQENGNGIIVDSSLYDYPEAAQREGSAQHSYYLPGQYNPIGTKAMENSLWEGTS